MEDERWKMEDGKIRRGENSKILFKKQNYIN